MQINLTITVKNIQAQSHGGAKQMAFNHLIDEAQYMLEAAGIAVDDPGVTSPEGTWMSAEDQFMVMAKSYRETDGSFTVTIP